jgi:flagellar protein FliL
LILGLLLLAALRPGQAADRETGGKEALPGAPVFVDLQPIVLPVIEGNAVTREVGAVFTIELAEGRSADDVRPRRRELIDAFITELHRTYDARSSANRVVDEAALKQRLKLAADRVLGAGAVRTVLIRQLVERDR